MSEESKAQRLARVQHQERILAEGPKLSMEEFDWMMKSIKEDIQYQETLKKRYWERVLGCNLD
ncbi:hypothetical protein GCM10017044_03190 [Kordiimonas sediminis]|uniref:Uncharacterized protein n=1 Tax=Kordiimonas sediminis TaxID=1735581 RepID=A0A919AK66_9PROT|nr:hypothetical protein [Kordiimonas sediminis]GHF12590.1 hypothetical protein GCM10017044_03190 [Kordiimonas sediminis]